jgi:MFS family permease
MRDAMKPPASFRQLMRHPGFVSLWAADGLSNFGSFVFSLALQLLLIESLHADQLEIGWVRSAQWLPSLLFGLVAGVIVDRVRRKPLLIAVDFACCGLLLAIATLSILQLLPPAGLAVLVFALGTAAVLQGGAHQSFVADLLPPGLLAAGNVKLTQTYTAAQTVGPLLSGLLVRAVGAPFTMLVNAATYAISALLLMRVPDVQPPPVTRPATILADLKDGIAWVYRHPQLKPYALCLHLWFIGNSIAGTVYVFYATSLGLDGTAVGLTLACAGVAGLLGAALAERLARIRGIGVAILGADFVTGSAWIIAALAPDGGVVVLCLAQLIYGLGLGIRGPLEMSWRNAVTPSALRGRMNTTIRSFNWGLIAIAAPVGGWIALHFGNRSALLLAGAIMLATGTTLLLSRFRTAALPAET